jgi:hypothetical protein
VRAKARPFSFRKRIRVSRSPLADELPLILSLMPIALWQHCHERILLYSQADKWVRRFEFLAAA